MTTQPMDRGLFLHKTIEKIVYANNAHEDIRVYPENQTRNEDLIYWARQLYRGFLEDVLSRLYVPDLSPDERTIWVDEAYRRSDFDWRDKEKFKEFRSWVEAEDERFYGP